MTQHPADDDRPAGRPADDDRAGDGETSTPSSGAAGNDPFAAAFEGEAWDSSRRRRRRSSSSSGGSSSGGSSSGGSSSGGSSSGGSSGGSSSGRSPSRRGTTTDREARRRSRRLRHTRSVVVHAVLGIAALFVAWIVVTGGLAAYQLLQARGDLTALQGQLTSGSDRVTDTADSFARHAHRAEVLTGGPAWSGLAAVPWLGGPFESVRGVTAETSTLAEDAVPGLLAAAGDVNPRTIYRNGQVDLPAVSRAVGPVGTAAQAARAADARVSRLPSDTWLGPVDDVRARFADELHDVAGTLTTTDTALRVLPGMLGADGTTKRYFVAFQNNAELRGTGGLPGAFAILSATDGKVKFERFESDSLLGGTIPSGLNFGKAYDEHWAGDQAYSQYVSSNESPHFPYAAQIWQAMWQRVSGERVDGALTVDPGALSYLLAVTGPTQTPDGKPVTADNVVALLQKDVYAQFPDPNENQQRKDYILGVAEAVERKVLSARSGGRSLLDALGRGVSERRILAWSADPAVQEVLGAAPIGGTVVRTDQPYSQLVVNNGAAGKLDYYLDRKVTVQRSGCGDTREVTVTMTFTNTAPASGLPPYVTTRFDDPPYPTVPGQNRLVVDYLATNGAQLLSATLDGKPNGAAVFDEEGHPSFRQDIELTPGQTRTWVLNLSEPAGSQPYTVIAQPGVTPVQVEVDDPACS